MGGSAAAVGAHYGWLPMGNEFIGGAVAAGMANGAGATRLPGRGSPAHSVTGPDGLERRVADALAFGLATFGRALGYFPYALLGIEEMGRQGLGAGRRGAFRLDEVWAENPLLGRQEAVYRRERE